MRRRRLTHLSNVVEDGSINLTPLIDVVFVVLIMFILIAPMLELDRVKLAKAGAHEVKEKKMVQEGSKLTIHVREDNSIWVNHTAVTLENLPTTLRSIYAKEPKLTPQLFHDKKAYFGTYQAVKNAVENVGFEELDLILEPEK